MPKKPNRVPQIIAIVIVGFIFIQLLPVGNFIPLLADPVNSPTTNIIDWNSTITLDLLSTACYDCHSNQTRFPWYSRIAPVSWLVNSEVNRGRKALNFSSQSLVTIDADNIAKHITSDMPPATYLLLHPEARLTPIQKTNLSTGLKITFGAGGQMDMGH